MNVTRVLVTGAAGFIGQHLCERLLDAGAEVVAAVRREADINRMWPTLKDRVRCVAVGDVDGETDWMSVLQGCDCVVHLAGRAHVMHEHVNDAMEAFRTVNVAGTMRLAEQAERCGVGRFVFMSSIGVNGNETTDVPFTEDLAPAPHSSYARSKLEAERALQELAVRTGLQVVILRPPLVYGCRAPGNFSRLVKLVRLLYVLPFASIRNRRSFIYVGNLVDVITRCVNHPAAAGKIFLVSDGEDISTPDLMRRMAAIMGLHRLVVPFPVSAMQWLVGRMGRADSVQRLIDSLLIDGSAVHKHLDWHPPYTLEQGLKASLGKGCCNEVKG